MAYDVKGKTNKELQDARGKIWHEAKAYSAEHEATWTGENQACYEAMFADMQTIKATLDRRANLETLESAGSYSGASSGVAADPAVSFGGNSSRNAPRTISVRVGNRNGKPYYRDVAVTELGSAAYESAFEKFLRGAGNPTAGVQVTPDEMAVIQSDNAGRAGYLLASEQFAAGLLKDVDDLVFIRKHAKIHTVHEAGSLGIRKRVARSKTFNWGPELDTSAPDTQYRVGKKVLTPDYMTGQIELSRDLIRRSAGGAVNEVMYELSRDAAETMEDGYMYGEGPLTPVGVFVPSVDGISTSRDVKTGSATGFTTDGLLRAKFGLKSQWRNGSLGEVRWLLHRDAVLAVSLLKDLEGRHIWQAGLQDGQPDRLLSYPIDESERAPNTLTDGNYAGLLANWQGYEIADALDMEIQVLYEVGAQKNMVIYIARLKTDGMPTQEEAFVRLKCGT